MRVMMTDYGVGNLHSIRKALEKNGATVDVVTDMSRLPDADCIVFPGVGAFDRTLERLLPYREDIRRRLLAGVPALGICIGAQILFGSSEEGGSPGLGVFDGKVVRLEAERIPHMGWNLVRTTDPIMDGIDDRHFYFAHSYRCSPVDEKDAIGSTEYEGKEF
ncbi:MAG: imidazole glycerol phosphate synthase subunit HisH, partial [Candidatus Methanoplasma sp.]|nr:imidazole glycerol phosphate synthase subunit HisH [Candidatus Methanoplasma sp.]